MLRMVLESHTLCESSRPVKADVPLTRNSTACPIALLNHLPEVPDLPTPAGALLGCPETQDFGRDMSRGIFAVGSRIGDNLGLPQNGVFMPPLGSVSSCFAISFDHFCLRSRFGGTTMRLLPRRTEDLTPEHIEPELSERQRTRNRTWVPA